MDTHVKEKGEGKICYDPGVQIESRMELSLVEKSGKYTHYVLCCHRVLAGLRISLRRQKPVGGLSSVNCR